MLQSALLYNSSCIVSTCIFDCTTSLGRDNLNIGPANQILRASHYRGK
uniref:Uncharacterized protein n=1 Tax=Arundo donax TaxID=35708 RepID=A0A0A9ADZ7_ARUDO